MAKPTELEKARLRGRPGPNTRHNPQPCNKCRALIIYGYSDRQCAWTVHLDPTPVTLAGETAARLLHHKRSYNLDHREITYRQWDRPTRSGGTPPQTGAILLDHKCEQPIPPQWVDHSIKKTTQQLSDKPEF